MSVIKKSSLVTLYYRVVVFETGAVVFDTFSSTPATLEVGSGTLNHEFEACLLGLSVGDEREFFLTSNKAFGTYRSDLVRTVKRSLMGSSSVSEGQRVSVESQGFSMVGIVLGCDEEGNVKIDFNHPLSGKTIVFTVKIVGVL